ncbi:SNF1-interacting protein [Linderina macrospora]|uniref:SNF1-interacting protein n=1 Tax=Linderina macrospora TaxID=4868 RepID=A0ACC1JI54_9FUNG|nr:SNF1-interacting protein [Linderina macrospora]
MGNTPTKLNGATVCDYGNLLPNGIYPEDVQDFDVKIVQKLILGRQLAPFYVGADDPDPAEGGEQNDDGWWSYNLMLAQQQKKDGSAVVDWVDY